MAISYFGMLPSNSLMQILPVNMFIINWLHRTLDYALPTVKLVQNREVGWQCLNRNTGQY